QSPLLGKFYCAPGSFAISQFAETVEVDIFDFKALGFFCSEKKIDLVVVGPEAPLAAGLSDALTAQGIKVFGPTLAGARLESSKIYAKEFMLRHNIPTAGFKILTNFNQAKEEINKSPLPLVLKADGLAMGKGVAVCFSREEAMNAASGMLEKKVFGPAGATVLLEEFMGGKEASAMAFCDGKTYCLLPISRDHKRLLDNNKGPNTGGMGAYAPVADIDEQTLSRIKAEIFDRFISGAQKDKIDYRGIIYAGIMLTPQGPKVVEFNCRFGDPETQAVMPLVKADVLKLMADCAEGKLSPQNLYGGGFCVSVVLAIAGYPGDYKKGLPIRGIPLVKDAMLFHGGTRKENSGWATNGGRVMCVCAKSENMANARAKVYGELSKIKFEGMQYRRDIGDI
ncbi:MAG: phosphoribosylamine--glycine ligase, partial [Elusimicrobia bacterium]|nr:phosphoribosylamine--glycine ligase [Elusimicrobiota bacterium]